MAVALGQLRGPVALPVTGTRHTEGLAAGFGGQLDGNKTTGKGWCIYTFTHFSASFRCSTETQTSYSSKEKAPFEPTVKVCYHKDEELKVCVCVWGGVFVSVDGIGSTVSECSSCSSIIIQPN